MPIPESVIGPFRNFDLKQLYNTLDFGLGAGAEFNIKLGPKWIANVGVKFDKSIGSIENHAFTLDTLAPLELYYPLSTKKETRPSTLTTESRNRSTNMSLGVYVGLTYKFKEGRAPKKRPVDDLQQNP